MNYTIEKLAESLRAKSLGKKEYISLLCHRSNDEGKAAWNKHEGRVAHAILHGMKEGETEGHKGRSKQSYGCASKHKVGLSGSPKEGTALFKAMEFVREFVRESFLKAKFERLTIKESGLWFHEFVQVAKELYAIPLSFRKDRDGNLSFTNDSLIEYGMQWDADILTARKEAKEAEQTAEQAETETAEQTA
jgi:hypothetical protein